MIDSWSRKYIENKKNNFNCRKCIKIIKGWTYPDMQLVGLFTYFEKYTQVTQ